LFEVHQTKTFERGGYNAQIDITSAGHVITWRCGGMTLTEVAASAQHPLPKKRRLLSYRLAGEQHDEVQCRGGVVYKTTFQLETVQPQFFWSFQEELCLENSDTAMLQSFEASGRIALGALSYISVETRNRSISFQAFHTFPDDCAVVKTESQFLLP